MTQHTFITITHDLIIGHDLDGQLFRDKRWNVQAVTIDTNVRSSYELLKDTINGTIQVSTTHEGVDVWFDDEFLFKGMDVNPIASVIMAPVVIHGPVVLARSNSEGDTIGFSEEEIEMALDKLARVAEALAYP